MRKALIVITGMAAGMVNAATPSFVLDDQSVPPAQAATFLVSLESAVQKNDLKAYCAAIYDRPAVVPFYTRLCQGAGKRDQGKSGACAESAIREHVRQEKGRCLAMPSREFENVRKDFHIGLAEFVKDTKNQGMDGSKLLSEARAASRKPTAVAN